VIDTGVPRAAIACDSAKATFLAGELSNPIYVGEIRHKDLCHPGQHEPILDRELWERTQQ
jgi:hypothetical protein